MKKIAIKLLIPISLLNIYSCQLLTTSRNSLNLYDGTYSVSFICGEKCMATSIINIKDGKIEEKVHSINKHTFNVIGFVMNTGKLQLSITSDLNEKLNAHGNISNDGHIEGSYSVGSRNCKFLGFIITKNSNEKITKYDGLYDIIFKRKEKLMARAKINIKDGAFHTFIRTINNDIYKVNGKISKEGKILLNTIFNQNQGVTATGSVRDGFMKGEYYISDGSKGSFIGKLNKE